MAFTEHASKKYVDERNALLATKAALNAEAGERERLANIVAQNRRDTYSKDEVNRIVEALRGARFEKVQALPELADADTRTIYLLPRATPETGNTYDEWIVLVDGVGARSWEKIGSTDIDLSGYATKEEVQGVRDSVNNLASDVDALQDDITADSSRISTLENKVDNPSQVPTEDSNDLISSGGVFAALADKADKETDERFMRAKADVYLSARKGNDANDGLAPGRAVKTIGRAYAAAKAAVDAQTLDGTKQVVVAVDEGVYGSVKLNCELTAGIAFRAVGARESTFVVPSNDPGDGANQTPMSCDNGVYPRVFEMEGFTFTGFNGRHHTDINWDSHQRGIVYGMTLRRCLITGNRPICTKAFVCGTFIDCEITGNATRPTPEGAGGDAPFGGYGAVYNDLAYMTRMFNCHVWDNDFSTFQFFASKIEASGCLFENSFAVAKGVSDSYGGHNNTMIAERYTNPYFTYSDTRSKFYKIGVNYFAVIASPAGSTSDPFYTETDTYVCVQSATLTEGKVAADASCPSVRSDGSLDFGYRDSGFGRKKTADSKQDALTAQQLANIDAVPGKASKSDVEPLLFAQYYPNGNVKSTAEFTLGIKYDAPDTTNRTITVKPFCNTGSNDNSSIVGRVVIPPFVDAQGNPYISDDGTRFKVVGVGRGSFSHDINNNLTGIVAPITITGIDYFAFIDCISLNYISAPEVRSIGQCAFTSCTSLTTVDFGDTPRQSVPTLGSDAFVNVPTSLKIIVPDAQYDAWTAPTIPNPEHEGETIPNPWYDLVTAGYKFLKHSEWEEYASVKLSGETMPANPTQNELAEAVKKIFTALGGTVTP